MTTAGASRVVCKLKRKEEDARGYRQVDSSPRKRNPQIRPMTLTSAQSSATHTSNRKLRDWPPLAGESGEHNDT